MNKLVLAGGILTCLLMVSFSGCVEQDPFEGLAYVNTYYNYGFNPPEGFTNQTIPEGIVFYGPTEHDFKIYLGVTPRFTLQGSETLTEYMFQLIQNYSQKLNDFTLRSIQNKIINKMESCEIIYTFNSTAEPDKQLKVKQVGYEKGGTIIAVTYAAPFESFGTYLENVNQSFDSFVMT